MWKRVTGEEFIDGVRKVYGESIDFSDAVYTKDSENA